MKQLQSSVIIKTNTKTYLVNVMNTSSQAVILLKNMAKSPIMHKMMNDIINEPFRYGIETTPKDQVYEYKIKDIKSSALSKNKKMEAVPYSEHLADSPIAWEKHTVYRAIDKCFTCALPLTHPLSVYHGVGPVCGGFSNTKEYRKGLKGKLDQRELDAISIDWEVIHKKMEKAKYEALGINEGLSNPKVLGFVKETLNAVQLMILSQLYWFPKKSVIYIKQTNTLYVQSWLLKKEKNVKLALHKKMMSS